MTLHNGNLPIMVIHMGMYCIIVTVTYGEGLLYYKSDLITRSEWCIFINKGLLYIRSTYIKCQNVIHMLACTYKHW